MIIIKALFYIINWFVNDLFSYFEIDNILKTLKK